MGGIPHRHVAPPSRPLFRALALALPVLLGGCMNGDFGRPKSSLVLDNIHGWIGTEAARGAGIAASHFPLTDDERALRDLAYPLIEPPYDRNRWYSLLNEYGATRALLRDWSYVDPTVYGTRLMAKPYRSAAARYAQLNVDIRNDAVRLPAFFSLARRVLDVDRKREKGLAMVSPGPPDEAPQARSRIAENNLIVSWVQKSVADRAASYRWALERLVVATPHPVAVESERSIALLRQRLDASRLVDGPDRAPGPVALVGPGGDPR